MINGQILAEEKSERAAWNAAVIHAARLERDRLVDKYGVRVVRVPRRLGDVWRVVVRERKS